MILISGKTNFQIRNITRDKGGHFLMIKWLIHQEGNMIINVYMPNNIGPK